MEPCTKSSTEKQEERQSGVEDGVLGAALSFSGGGCQDDANVEEERNRRDKLLQAASCWPGSLVGSVCTGRVLELRTWRQVIWTWSSRDLE